MARRAFLAPAVAAALAGCSHTYYQFHIDAVEQREIVTARNALVVAAQGDVSTLSAVVDLDGRRAVETLVAGMTVEHTAADRQYERLARALYLGVMGDAEDPLAALDSDLAMIAGRVAQRVAAHTIDQFGFGGFAAMVGMVGDDSSQRLREMQGSLVRARIGVCTELHPVISYDAGILGHIRSQLADNDPVYADWRSRVRAIHLVRFACPHGHVLMVLTKNAGEAGVRAIGWHHVSPAQWATLEPRLREALDLP
ncbi:MAG TPA: hypothetical protein VIL20_29880 [Sandaracinaceae bacterium]